MTENPECFDHLGLGAEIKARGPRSNKVKEQESQEVEMHYVQTLRSYRSYLDNREAELRGTILIVVNSLFCGDEAIKLAHSFIIKISKHIFPNGVSPFLSS